MNHLRDHYYFLYQSSHHSYYFSNKFYLKIYINFSYIIQFVHAKSGYIRNEKVNQYKKQQIALFLLSKFLKSEILF